MSKVYIGVGHGGSDNGAVANGLKEDEVNLDVALACQNYLAPYVQTKISRTKDVDSSINSKVNEANSWGADIVVEIHHNAGGGDGCEVYYHVGGGKSKTLAQDIINGIVAIGQQSRGIKTKTLSDGTDYFGIIRNTNAPAVLVECAFIDSKDKEIVDTHAERVKMGEAIAKGILKYFSIAETSKPASPTTTTAAAFTSPYVMEKDDSGIGVYFLKCELRKLKAKGIITQSVDDNDKFGDGTVTAVKQAQKAAGITVDGIAGVKTARALAELLSK